MIDQGEGDLHPVLFGEPRIELREDAHRRPFGNPKIVAGGVWAIGEDKQSRIAAGALLCSPQGIQASQTPGAFVDPWHKYHAIIDSGEGVQEVLPGSEAEPTGMSCDVLEIAELARNRRQPRLGCRQPRQSSASSGERRVAATLRTR